MSKTETRKVFLEGGPHDGGFGEIAVGPDGGNRTASYAFENRGGTCPHVDEDGEIIPKERSSSFVTIYKETPRTINGYRVMTWECYRDDS